MPCWCFTVLGTRPRIFYIYTAIAKQCAIKTWLQTRSCMSAGRQTPPPQILQHRLIAWIYQLCCVIRMQCTVTVRLPPFITSTISPEQLRPAGQNPNTVYGYAVRCQLRNPHHESSASQSTARSATQQPSQSSRANKQTLITSNQSSTRSTRPWLWWPFRWHWWPGR